MSTSPLIERLEADAENTHIESLFNNLELEDDDEYTSNCSQPESLSEEDKPLYCGQTPPLLESPRYKNNQ